MFDSEWKCHKMLAFYAISDHLFVSNTGTVLVKNHPDKRFQKTQAADSERLC